MVFPSKLIMDALTLIAQIIHELIHVTWTMSKPTLVFQPLIFSGISAIVAMLALRSTFFLENLDKNDIFRSQERERF